MFGNALTIFSFYEQEGYVDDYVIYLLEQLQVNSERLIVVVNGAINHGRKRIEEITKEIYIRENVGYDSGAYKDVIFNYLNEGELQKYDYLILCNDTFYGPFIPLANILSKFNDDCDFFGLNYMRNSITGYLQSFFLVFNKRIIESQCIENYFKNYISEDEYDINKIYTSFETGLFNYLKYNGYKYGSYSNIQLVNPYYSGNEVLKQGLPILKKKFFLDSSSMENIIEALSWINDKYDFDLNILLRSVERRNPELKIKEWEKRLPIDKNNIVVKYDSSIANAEKKIIEYLNNHEEVYVYGAGGLAELLYKSFVIFRSNSFKGFITTKKSEGSFLGKPVYAYNSEVDSSNVIVALNESNTKGLLEQIGYKERWLYLYEK